MKLRLKMLKRFKNKNIWIYESVFRCNL